MSIDRRFLLQTMAGGAGADVPLRGHYAWHNDAVWLATVEAAADRRSATYTCYEVA